jgi:hypothetical protein
MARKGQEGKWKRIACRPESIDRRYLSEYKLAACAWPSQAAILEITSVVYKLEIALLATSVESSAISLWGQNLFMLAHSLRSSGADSVQLAVRLYQPPRSA